MASFLDSIVNEGKQALFIDGYRFTLEFDRGQQGKVGWKIKMKGDKPDEIVDRVKQIDAELSGHFKPIEKEVKKDVTGKKTAV